ncbi:MAG: flagellar motor switch protein FliN [Oscillospiraceae bacterium]
METNQAATTLSPMEIDAIGEVLNISMGAAATAVSSMLDKMVTITTPKVDVESISTLDCGALEPAIIVKITYTEGLDGSNVMVFRQKDMQVILNQLMGIEESSADDFVFDELSMSAACEVMNQMMGAAATALAEFLGIPINISTPTAEIMDNEHTFQKTVGLDDDVEIISVLFDMNIQGVMNTEFISVLPSALAKMIVSKFMPEETEVPKLPDPVQPQMQPPTQPQMQPPTQPQMQQPTQPQMQAPVQPQMQQPAQPQYEPPMQPQYEPPRMVQPVQQQMQPPQMPPQQLQPPMGGMPPYYPYQQPPQGYPYYYAPPVSPVPPQQRYDAPEQADPVNIRNVQFPEFGRQNPSGQEPIMGKNVELLMNVPLDVAIEIGQTKKKIRDIMNFVQGTVIELDKQAGAPIDIVVNGQLIAHGDVVVIDDNFGVRITEIVGTKELLNSLEKEMQ